MIAEVLECKGDELTLGHSCDTEIEPGPIVLIIGAHMRRRVTRYPNVEAVAVPASLCLGHISRAELAAKDDARVGDRPPSALWERVQELSTVG